MGLISLCFLVAFALLYLSKSMDENKPAFVDKAASKIKENIDVLAFWGLLYGLAAFILTPVMIRYAGMDMLVRLVANLMLMLMALPYSMNHITSKYGERINEKIAEELNGFANFLVKHEQIVGIVGTIAAVLLFTVLFR